MSRLVVAALLVTALFGVAPAGGETLPPAGAEAAPAAAPTAAATAGEGGKELVNINEASEVELGYLPGIGPAKAKAIMEKRRGHPFRRPDELTKVKGIGKKTLGKLRPYIAVAGPTTLKHDIKSR